MSGVRGLQTYITETAAARHSVELTRDKFKSAKKKSHLLCDFFPVVEWLLSAYDAHLVEVGQLSPYALLYGGDLRLYGQRIMAFVKALKHIGLSPVFFIEGSPGANLERFDMQYSKLHRQHDHLIERCVTVYQVCEGIGDILQVHWQLGQDTISEITRSLQFEGVHLEYCACGTTLEMIEYQRNHSSVIGVLSTNTDFAVAAGSKLFPISLFDLKNDIGVSSSQICQTPGRIVCERVDPSILSQSLQLHDERNLIDISILCGNQFTANLNKSLDPCKTLGISCSSFEYVAHWVADLDPSQWPCIGKKLQLDSLYCDAIARSFELYDDQRDSVSPPGNIMNEGGVILKVRVKLYDPVLSSIVNGVYWKWPVLEPVSLGQTCFSDLTLPLRKKAYSILGADVVLEHGRTSSKSFDTVSVQGNVGSSLCVNGWSEAQCLVTLFRIITDPEIDTSSDSLKEEAASIVSELGGDCLAALPTVVLICGSLCFMYHLASQSGYHLEPDELQALLITCLFCSSSVSPVVIPERPTSRALTVAMQFSHTLEQVQLLASTMCLGDVLPLPSTLFYPMAYIPIYMASVTKLQPSSNLKEAYHNYQWVVNKPQTSTFMDEIRNNWKQPNLKRLSDLFVGLIECIRNHSSFLFYGSQLSSTPPPHLQFNFTQVYDDEDEHLDVESTYNYDSDISEELEGQEMLMVTPESDHDWSEVSSSQDRLALEDFQYFSQEIMEGGEGDGSVVVEGHEGSVIVEREVSAVEDNGGSVVAEMMENTVGSDEGNEERDVETVQTVREEDKESCVDSEIEVGTANVSQRASRSKSLSPLETKTAIVSSENENDVTLRPPTPTPSPAHSSSYSYSYDSSESESTPPPSSQLSELQRRCGVDLPIAAHRNKLLQLIDENRVVCVEGETGCGKSTRVPQYILDYSRSLSPPRHCRVLITQPRRMAAIKLAERVANERGERVGFTVGYSVGGEQINTSEAAITYCTTGYLLQALVHNPDIVHNYTHIILDEIHERNTDADFTLLVVRELLGTPKSEIKLVIMSATMQGSLVVDYLQQHFDSVAGPYFVGVKHYDVETFFIDELGNVPQNQVFWDTCQLKAATNLQQLADDRPRESLSSVLTTRPIVSAYGQEVCTEIVISKANLGESILIFLPGYQEIAQYFDHLQDVINARNIGARFRIFILHSQVPLEDQKDAFIDPPTNIAHVILATNIAESSITLPKLRVVINFGIYRRLQYDSKRHISCLVKSWCSRASCEQRAGRAGRVFLGTVVHLFTRQFHDVVLPAYDPPEILTAPISKLVLQAKQIGKMIGHPRPSKFLSRAIEPPSLQQLEAALQDLARLGAIESHPGEAVDEEANITFLGQFSLSLPVDLDLSRVVLFGALFGCVADAIVIAASMSLSQEVLSLPSRVLMKDEKEFQQSLSRSFRNRYSLDSECCSDAILVRNLFRKWLIFRSENGNISKINAARKFSAQNACRWERLLQLESVTSEIAQKTLRHIPSSTTAHRELKKLICLHRLQMMRGRNSHQGITPSESFNVEFCNNEDVIRAMLAAAYPHQLLFGISQCLSSNDKEKSASLAVLKLIENSDVDIARTVAVTCDKKSSKAVVEQLVGVVLPQNFCQINSFGATSLITLNHTFETNPLTALLHDQNIMPTAHPVHHSSVEDKLISSSLPPELILLWQFGERRPKWKAGGISVNFSRPQHPLAVSWVRVTGDKEMVRILSWRNPTGLVCDVNPNRKSSFFLAVAGNLQGFGSRSYVSANHISLLPSLHSSRNALLIALAFQPLTAKVNALVNHVQHRIIGLDVNTFTLPSLQWMHHLDPVDMHNINQLRKQISEVFTSNFANSQLSANFLLEVPYLLSKLLLYGRLMLNSPAAEVNGTSDKKHTSWERMIKTVQHDETIIESDSEDENSEDVISQKEYKSVDNVYQYLPPFQCSILEHLPEETAAVASVVNLSHSDTESESRNSFKLSPNAPEFVPTPLPDNETASPLVYTDADDHSISPGTSASMEAPAAQAKPVSLPLPTPVSNLPLFDVLNPQLLSTLSVLPSDQQQNIIWKLLSTVNEVLPKSLTSDKNSQDKSMTTCADQFPKQLKHHHGQPLLDTHDLKTRHSSISVSPISSVGLGVPVSNVVQPPLPPTTSHHVHSTISCPNLTTTSHTSNLCQETVSKTHFYKPVSQLFTPSQSPVIQKSQYGHRSGIQTRTPQFPYPYTGLLPQSLPPSLPPSPLPVRKSTTVTSSRPPPFSGFPMHSSLSSLPSMATDIVHFRPPSSPQVLTKNIQPKVQFPKYARRPLLDPFQNKLNLSSRAPGAHLNTVGGHYQARYPFQPLLPLSMRPPPGFAKSKKVLSPSIPTRPTTLPPGLKYAQYGVDSGYPSERFHSPSVYYSASTPPSTTDPAVLLRAHPQYQVICSDLANFIEVYFQKYGHFEKAKVLLEMYLTERRLSNDLFKPLMFELPNILYGRFKMSLSPINEVIIGSIEQERKPPSQEQNPSSNEAQCFLERQDVQTDIAKQTIEHDPVPNKEVMSVEVESDDTERNKAGDNVVSVDIESDSGSEVESKSVTLPDYISSSSQESELAPSLSTTEFSVEGICSQPAVHPMEQLSPIHTSDIEDLSELHIKTCGSQAAVEDVELSDEKLITQTIAMEEPVCSITDLPQVEASDGLSSATQTSSQHSSEDMDLTAEETTAMKVPVCSITQVEASDRLSSATQTNSQHSSEDMDLTLLAEESMDPLIQKSSSEAISEADQTIESDHDIAAIIKERSNEWEDDNATRDMVQNVELPFDTAAHSPVNSSKAIPLHDPVCHEGDSIREGATMLPGLPYHSTQLTSATQKGEYSMSSQPCIDGSEGRSQTSPISTSHMISYKKQDGFESHEIDFFVACLQLVGGHSHVWKLGYCYRVAYGVEEFINSSAFLKHSDMFQVPGMSCIQLVENLDLEKIGINHVELDPEIVKVLNKYSDVCPLTGKNCGGNVIYFQLSTPKIKRKPWSSIKGSTRMSRKSFETDRGRRARSQTPSQSERRYSKSSSRLSKTRSISPPHFPKDVEIETDPGHISHILKFYNEFFTTRTAPILYSDLLTEYIKTTSLPGDFYLPSDLLKNQFHVYRQDQKRYIRPLDKIKPEENVISASSPSLSNVVTVETRKSPNEERGILEPGKGKVGAKTFGKQRVKSSLSVSKSVVSVSSKSVAKDPSQVKSPTTPGHKTHIKEYFRNHFARLPEPIMYSELLEQYITECNLPSKFRIMPSLFKEEFKCYFLHGLRYITMRSEQHSTVHSRHIESDTTGAGVSMTQPSKGKVTVKEKKMKKDSVSTEDSISSKSTWSAQIGSLEDVKCPTQPGHFSHILKFYNNLFYKCRRPLPLHGFSLRYIRFYSYSLPPVFRIPKEFYEQHFKTYTNKRDRRVYVIPLSWAHEAAPVAPVVHNDVPVTTEVWEVDDIENVSLSQVKMEDVSLSQKADVLQQIELPESQVIDDLPPQQGELDGDSQSQGFDDTPQQGELDGDSQSQGFDDIPPQGELDGDHQSREVDDLHPQGELDGDLQSQQCDPQSLGVDDNITTGE